MSVVRLRPAKGKGRPAYVPPPMEGQLRLLQRHRRLAIIGAAIGHTQVAGSFYKQQALELVSALITGAPVLYGATAAALLVALTRAFRSARRP